MKTNYRLALTLLVGTALGAAAIQALHAQATPPVYVVTEISEVTDLVGQKTNTDRPDAVRGALLQEFGGRTVARTEKIEALDGTPPKRFIMTAFDSKVKAHGWLSSPGQKKVNEVRFKTTKSRSFIVEGL
jgi:uncharacterized protein (DUF1330 family)